MNLDPTTSSTVYETLRDAQRLGFFGHGPIEQLVEHARLFLPPLRSLSAGALVVDIGSGGGAPALVIADARPDLRVEMIDRRRKRTDFLERAIRRLQMKNATVVETDVKDEVRRARSGERALANALTARGFGPPEAFLAAADSLVVDGGIAVISEPPDGFRWTSDVMVNTSLTPLARDVIDDDDGPAESGLGTPTPSPLFTGGVQVFRRAPRSL